MKELSIKKKLEDARSLYKDANEAQRYVLELLFPELHELEDERIKKSLINYIKAYGDSGDFTKEEYIAWIEKQGQKETIWNEEDEENMNNVLYIFNQLKDTFTYEEDDFEKIINWLKSLKDRVQPQNKWKPTEEQMDALDSAIQYSNISYESSEYLDSLFNDLKKLKR